MEHFHVRRFSKPLLSTSQPTHQKLAPVQGFEPRRTVLETVMLPLHHTDMGVTLRIELSRRAYETQVRTTCITTLFSTAQWMKGGFEPFSNGHPLIGAFQMLIPNCACENRVNLFPVHHRLR